MANLCDKGITLAPASQGKDELNWISANEIQ
jgi:hypothetical protein